MNKRAFLFFVAVLLAPLSAVHAAGAPVTVARAITPHPTEAKLLLMGNWADPSILKDGDDYYMTHSSFEFQPGLLVWHES